MKVAKCGSGLRSRARKHRWGPCQDQSHCLPTSGYVGIAQTGPCGLVRPEAS